MLWLTQFATITAVPAYATPEVTVVDGERMLTLDGDPVLQVNTPWVATVDWQNVHTVPRDVPEGSERIHEDEHGKVTERITVEGDTVTIRYEFAFADMPGGQHIQWFWRLEPERFDGATIEADGRARAIEGASVSPLNRIALLLPDVDLSVEVSAADGLWAFSDQCRSPWANCYRLEYNRDFSLDGSREGWCEAKITLKQAPILTIPLTQGRATQVRGLPFEIGPPREQVDRSLAGMLVWHTADEPARRGEVVGEVVVTYEDGQEASIPLVWETNLTAPGDDPRDLPGGALTPLPDGSPAWLSAWRSPRPETAIRSIRAAAHAAGWRLVAATGVDAAADERRLAMTLKAGQGRAPLSEENVVSLDGTWRFHPAGGEEREITVPARWETVQGLRDVHQAAYRREFEAPASFAGQRVLVRFDSVGDFCEVTVNGHYVGEHLGSTVPFEVDVTEWVDAPSTGNTLEVAVKDDTHFSVPRPNPDWRDRRHWIPHGIGGNNRKGLWQSVSLRGRPAVRIADARIRTSFREKTLSVTYELFNSHRQTFTGELSASVRLHGGGEVALTLPTTPVELPGFVTTTVTVEALWENPKLWQPDHPDLYDLRSILADADGQRAHRVDTRFGFREVWFEGIHFYLNGIRCNLRGESPSYQGSSQHMDTREAAERMVKKCLDANFNVLRFHALPAPQHVYDVCDELGMMVIDESAIYSSWGMVMPEHPRWMAECERHLSTWVRRDRNHPSVILWSAENEGLNVSQLTPAMLAEFRRIIDEHDGSRPVIFAGDGAGYGASPASSKHYVRTVDELKDRGGKSSGYGRDLRHDIYWATEYKQDIPLGVSEFLFPANDAMREKHREVCAMMGLQTRGYRYADWFDIRPYNPHYTGFVDELKEGYNDIWDLIVKSFAPVAVFDKGYDALGPFPEPPELQVGEAARRTLIVYNDTFADEAVSVAWEATLGGRRLDGGTRKLEIPLGYHTEFEIEFTPDAVGDLELHLASAKAGEEQFSDTRRFAVVD